MKKAILSFCLFAQVKLFSQLPYGVIKFTDKQVREAVAHTGILQVVNTGTMHAQVFSIPAHHDSSITADHDMVYYIFEGKCRYESANQKETLSEGSVFFLRSGINVRISDVEKKLLVLSITPNIEAVSSPDAMIFKLDTIQSKASGHDNDWEPFLRNKSMTFGLYILPKEIGGDSTLTHQVDELNYVTKGESDFTINDYTIPVKKGDIIFVPKTNGHYFHKLGSDFDVLIFWEKKSLMAK